MLTATLFNIQKFSVHDGPGIRTTFFFKGCPMRCAWCHNPESLAVKPELLLNKEKCNRCGECADNCKDGSIKMIDGEIAIDNKLFDGAEDILDECMHNALSIAGTPYTIDQVVKEALKDQVFYEESGGGVTLSGGECLMQIDFVENFLKRLKEKKIHTTVDTCGHVPTEYFERILPLVDLFLYDLKHTDIEDHKDFTNVDNQLILSNLRYLSEQGATLHLRLPIIVGVNATNQHMEKVVTLVDDLNIEQINLLPYHSIGQGKYDRLNLAYDKEAFAAPSDEQLNKFKALFTTKNISVVIGG